MAVSLLAIFLELLLPVRRRIPVPVEVPARAEQPYVA